MPDRDSPRLAIIGCGSFTECRLIPALRRIRWRPTVLVDNSPERISAIRGRIGRTSKTMLPASDWKSVESHFDAALVAAPGRLHGAMGIALSEAGKHVFVEAPLAKTVDESIRMISAARKTGVALSVGSLRRHLSIARWTKGLVDSGVLGEITHFDIREGSVINSDLNRDAIFKPTIADGAVLSERGCPALDLMVWWLGEVDSVRYYDDAAGAVETNCVLECTLKSGSNGRVVLSSHSISTQFGMHKRNSWIY